MEAISCKFRRSGGDVWWRIFPVNFGGREVMREMNRCLLENHFGCMRKKMKTSGSRGPNSTATTTSVSVLLLLKERIWKLNMSVVLIPHLQIIMRDVDPENPTVRSSSGWILFIFKQGWGDSLRTILQEERVFTLSVEYSVC